MNVEERIIIEKIITVIVTNTEYHFVYLKKSCGAR